VYEPFDSTILRPAQRRIAVLVSSVPLSETHAAGLPREVWEYAALVTSLDAELLTLGQLYRDRGDCENAFDELQNQWDDARPEALPAARRQRRPDLQLVESVRAPG
jgi:hypothetical protein